MFCFFLFSRKNLKTKMKKYKIINKEDILKLFKEKKVVNRKDVTTKYGCSVYLTRRLIEDLQDDNKIKLTSYGYKQI